MVSFQFRYLILLNFFVAALFLGNAHAIDSEPTALEPSTGYQLIKVGGPEPVYPRKALFNGQEGWVDLRFTVAADGQVEDIDVVEANPRWVFERAALRAAAEWVFEAPSDSGFNRSISGVYRVSFASE
jgi:TonB family protein